MKEIRPLRSVIVDVRSIPKTRTDIVQLYIKFSETGDPGQIAWSHQGGGGAIKNLSGLISDQSWDELISMLHNNTIPADVAASVGIDIDRLKLRLQIETD